MKDRTTKWLVAGAVVSAVVMIIGYFLWTNLAPLQDINSYSPQELRNVQKEQAINYPLGSLLMNLGFVGFSSSLLALVVRQLLAFLKKKE
ncbi:hypothetical protein SAMN04488102_103295 [Alkalibacterium subtropicum]|uniref:Uncharacterized protein n=1 Tax=Alkalibacterium subtropicum TaxID=753702 RepID=A0A1I1H7H5_9LACT|nr:hypothetical protein [Alkalibacterium subtropicum]SFC17090.1 hypothetical protein SAMN04488102_103295 [Alkalibacterium subtropicum]